jgi:cytochrome d ubiquinol oxidase subunit I
MTEVALTLAGFVIFYTVLFIIEMGLMLKYIRKGPFQDVEETDAWVVSDTQSGWPDGAMPTPSPCQRSKTHDPARLLSTMTSCA